jgi:hypothetical protein
MVDRIYKVLGITFGIGLIALLAFYAYTLLFDFAGNDA